MHCVLPAGVREGVGLISQPGATSHACRGLPSASVCLPPSQPLSSPKTPASHRTIASCHAFPAGVWDPPGAPAYPPLQVPWVPTRQLPRSGCEGRTTWHWGAGSSAPQPTSSCPPRPQPSHPPPTGPQGEADTDLSPLLGQDKPQELPGPRSARPRPRGAFPVPVSRPTLPRVPPCPAGPCSPAPLPSTSMSAPGPTQQVRLASCTGSILTSCREQTGR